MANNYTRRISIFINGQEVKNDIASIKSEMNKLTNQQARMTRGSIEYVQAGQKIKAMRGIIAQHNNDLKGTAGLWDKLGNMGNKFNQYFSMFVAFAAGFGGLLYSGKKAISLFAEFDDKVGDVMKTTQLSKKTVYEMNEELKKMDTRTAQNELLNLGKVAGKLGLSSKEDVMGFIRAADKINVALKEDLGGDAEQAINEVGKLVDIFKVKEKFGIEDSMLKVGSSINALGAASTANEGYIVEFTKRVAGIAPSAGVNIQAVMGLAATLDQLGQTSEVSSTVYSAVMTGMFKDTAMYARIAGMSVGSFSSLLKKDANEAFVKFLEGLQGNSGGMTELTKKMDGLGLEGKRSIAVLGVLANNTDKLRESQTLSNKEFDKGTSLTNEFNVKNETAQAKLDKATKSLSNMAVELGQKLMPVLTVSTSGMGYFVKSVGVITDFLIKHSKAILITSTALGVYILRQQAVVFWENLKNISLGKGLVMTNLQAIAVRAQILITGEATMAQKRLIVTQNQMNASMMKTPWGLILAGVAAAVVAYHQYKNGLTEITRAKTEFYLTVVKDQKAMDNLFDSVKTTVAGSEERAAGIKKINEVYGQYLPNLLTEKSSLDEITTAQRAANLALVESATLRFKQKAADDILNKSLEKQKSALSEITQMVKDAKGDATADAFVPIFNQYLNDIGDSSLFDKAINDKTKKLADFYDIDILVLKANIDEIRKARKQQESDLKSLDSVDFLVGNKDKLLSKAQKLSELRMAMSRAETKEEKKQIQEQINMLEEKAKATSKTEKKDKKDKPFDFTNDTNKYSLNNDQAYVDAKKALTKKFVDGEIESKEQFDAKILDLDIEFLDKRIKLGIDSGADLASLQSELADKKIKQTENRLNAEAFMMDAIGVSELEKENQRYLDDLDNFGKYVGDKNKLTQQEMDALTGLQNRHQQNLNKIESDNFKKDVERIQHSTDNELAHLKYKNAEELKSITTLEQAKDVLRRSMNEEQLSKITSLAKAKKAIQEQQANEEISLQEKLLTDLQLKLNEALSKQKLEPINLGDELLSEDAIADLESKMNTVAEKIAALKKRLKGEDRVDNADKLHTKDYATDILGFTSEDWQALFDNLEDGKIGVNEIAMAVDAMKVVWENYNNYLTSAENYKLRGLEKSNNKQKDDLQKRLDTGLISQEAYNAKVKELDANLEAKKEEIAYRQAKRDAALAAISVIQNTAAAIMQLWVKPGFPLAIPLSVMVGGIGALQLATIANNMPEAPGAEEGGYLNVVRSQDGKRFNARNKPGLRGWVHTPTVITGENGSEYVAPAEAVNNPTIRPILDILEMARVNKNLSTLNFPEVYNSTVSSGLSGRESGGSLFNTRSSSAPVYSNDNELKQILINNTKAMEKLNSKLDDPIKTYVNIHGEKGLAKKLEDYYKIKQNADI